MKMLDVISNIIVGYISPQVGIDLLFLILFLCIGCLLYEKIDSKKVKYTIIFLLSIALLFTIHLRYEDEKTHLYACMYFNEIKARLFSDGLTVFNNSNEYDMISKNKIMMNIDYILTKVPVPYDTLKYTVDKYYQENTLKIPQQLLQELTEFVRTKIDKNKSLLMNAEAKKYLKQVFFDSMDMILEYSNKLKNATIIDEVFEIHRIFNNSIIGYFKNNNDYILIDYKKAISFLNDCEEEFTKTKKLLPY